MDVRYLALVLNDNETFTDADDCTIRLMPDCNIPDDRPSDGIIVAHISSPSPDRLIIYMNAGHDVTVEVINYN